jgi:membrane-bound lytic murein transglycosylase D
MPIGRPLTGLIALALLGPGLALPARAADDKKPVPAAKKAAPKAEPAKADAAKSEPPKSDTPKADPAKADAAKSEPKKAGKAAPAANAKDTKKPDPPPPTKKTEAPASAAAKKPAPPKPSSAAGSLPPLEATDPHHGQGTRKIETHPAPPAPPASPAPKPAETKATSARRGPPPKHPAATLPPGTPPRPVDFATRRQIAGGATADELRATKDDPELSKLEEAERVLFPRPLNGIAPGWSWELPAVPEEGAAAFDNGLPPSPNAVQSAPPSPKEADWLRGLAVPNLPVHYDDRLVKYLKFFRDSPSGSGVAKVWARKSGRYEAAVRAALARASLPTDLVWLSLIESGHNPSIVSPAGAVGLWQFMPETARTYGLTVDRWVDERLDPERETEAAVRFLADLYRRFGSWDLAMAAYNMGHGGLTRAIRKFNTNDFWELARHEAGIPWETTLYVPKILATAIVMNNKRAFGLDGITRDAPESFDVVTVGSGLLLSDIARAAGVDPSAVEELNPAYIAGRTPPVAPGHASVSYTVRLPRGAKPLPARLLALESARDELTSYSVKQGDTPASVARATGASEATVRGLNRIGAQETLAAGTLLLVPKLPPAPAAGTPRDDDVVVIARDLAPPPDTTRVFYPVVAGDSVDSVASAFGVARADVLAWNAIDGDARLQDGMVLQLFPRRSLDMRRLRHLRENDVKILVAGTPAFFDHFEALNGKRRLVVTVRHGDTLASIGRRYDTTVGWMERINRRSRNDELHAGETVVVYADRSRYPAKPAPAASARLLARAPVTDSPFASVDARPSPSEATDLDRDSSEHDSP